MSEKVLGFEEKDGNVSGGAGYWITFIRKKEVSVISIKRLKEIIEEQRNKNPYPIEVFVGTTEEGKIGKFACKVYNDCINDFLKTICEEVEK